MFERSFLRECLPISMCHRCIWFCWGSQEVIDNLVESSGASVLWSVALWTSFVSVPTPWRDERAEVAIFFSDWYTVIPVPSIGNSLLGPCRYQRCLVKRGLGMMCFTNSMFVEHLHVHWASWFAVFLPSRDHSMAQGNRFSNWDSLRIPELDISVDRRLHFLLQV